MIDSLSFLSKLKPSDVTPVLFLMGDDDWVRDTVRKRSIEVWSSTGEAETESLLLGSSIAPVAGRLGASSLFSSRKAIVLSESAGEKGTTFAKLGKNQVAELVALCARVSGDAELLILESRPLKSDNSVLKALSKVAKVIDVSTPKGGPRRKWIDLMARKSEVQLSPELAEALTASEGPLNTVKADIEKLALAVEPGETAGLGLWKDLTQADPMTSIWSIGESLAARKTGDVLQVLHDLDIEGLGIHDMLPALFTWTQQRLQIRSHQLSGATSPAEGVNPYILKKIAPQIQKASMDSIRNQASAIYQLERISKQSLENPEMVLQKTLIAIAEGKL